MSVHLKKALWRKRPLVTEILAVTKRFLESLKDKDVLSPEQVEEIKEQAENSGKVQKLLEALVQLCKDKQKIFLSQLALENNWLFQEVMAEYKAEAGILEIEGYIKDEAAAAVHRKFGRSKRFSENDKRQMALLIATNMQTAKESWKSQLEKLSRELRETLEIMQKRDNIVSGINDKMGHFLRRNHSQLSEVAYDFRSTTQTLLGISWLEESGTNEQIEDCVPILKYRIEVLLQKLSRLLVEKESLTRDREFCFRLLDATDKKRPLSDLIHEKLEELRKEKEKSEESMRNMKFKLIAIEELMRVKEKDLLLVDAELKEVRTKMELAAELKEDVTLPPVEGQQPATSARSTYKKLPKTRKSYPGAILTTHGFNKKPSTAIATVPPIRKEMSSVPSVPPIKKERTFLVNETAVS